MIYLLFYPCPQKGARRKIWLFPLVQGKNSPIFRMCQSRINTIFNKPGDFITWFLMPLSKLGV